MRKIQVYLNFNNTSNTFIGTLAEVDKGKIYFEYNKDYLAEGHNISPFKLDFKTGLQINKDRYPTGYFGVFNDSLPDAWGTLLMDRIFLKNNIPLQNITIIDRLSYIGNNAMGALAYVPSNDLSPAINDSAQIDLYKLSQNALEIIQGKAEVILPTIFKLGGSPGGARPKILVSYDGTNLISGNNNNLDNSENWLIKFRSESDFTDSGKIEYAYSEMARLSGIEITKTKLFQDHLNNEYFGTKRFDRGRDNKKFHIHTLSNLIHSNFIDLALDYDTLIRVCSVLTNSYEDIKKCFKLMVFNVAACNRDDHGKNFSFLMNENGKWSFAPAYDLTFSYGPGGEHSTTIAGEGKCITKSHILKIAETADIPKKEAISIISEICEAVNKFKEIANDLGINKSETNQIIKSFNCINL